MVTEYEVRQQVEEISRSAMAPMQKVRAILRVARTVKRQARALIHARALSAQATDSNTALHMDRMVRSLRMLYEEVRLAADRVIYESQVQPARDLALA